MNAFAKTILFIVIIIGAAAVIFFMRGQNEFSLPSGDSAPVTEASDEKSETAMETSKRPKSVTDGTTHSIPLNEILSGGPGKDGIPSIDNPEFVSLAEADKFLNEDDPGIGLSIAGESRFYPYRILVWHEIVNDEIQGQPLLITYCPLCATAIVFDRRVDGEAQEFGVSGRLWQSNLLMYNRASTAEGESLWSQILGEAVVGIHTGKRLTVVSSGVVTWKDWKELHPDTTSLSQNTGASRNYGRDPYGDYYTSESVLFGLSFRDTRLHPKALVEGIEIDGVYKAYPNDALPVGKTTDTFAGKTITIEKNSAGIIAISVEGSELSHVPGFWFAWLAVHPETELFAR